MSRNGFMILIKKRRHCRPVICEEIRLIILPALYRAQQNGCANAYPSVQQMHTVIGKIQVYFQYKGIEPLLKSKYSGIA